MKNTQHIRLWFGDKLVSGKEIILSDKDSHYLINVMRCVQGDNIRCFNASDGEFLAQIISADKKKSIVKLQKQLRQSEKEKDIWLLFAPLKKDKTDFVVEKAVELGASKIIPVLTRYTNTDKVKNERFEAQAKEAAEQCERLSVPEISKAVELKKLLTEWNKDRVLFFMDERKNGIPAVEAFKNGKGRPAAILIGPEGGFAEEEAEMLVACDFVKNVSLGPRILRAETAAAAALAVWQGIEGDWKK